ncbi:hypothetical protein QE152_g9704 [Popillia japonica]|uniref:Uncharacterized protein n=1 Tax=Popillia japonica TaxID=7064 RepID=A0AAW1LW06_POPJA
MKITLCLFIFVAILFYVSCSVPTNICTEKEMERYLECGRECNIFMRSEHPTEEDPRVCITKCLGCSCSTPEELQEVPYALC